MLKPRRSAVNQPSRPSSCGKEPAYQKKYASQTASPNANRMLMPATEKCHLRMRASVGPKGAHHLSTLRPGVDSIFSVSTRLDLPAHLGLPSCCSHQAS